MGFKFSNLFKRNLSILYGIILIGIYLRFFGVFTNSFAFTYDVGRDMLALRSILLTHKIPLIGATTGLPGIFYGPWWYILLFPFFVIFGGNPQGIAFVMASIGIASIVLAYLVGKKINGESLGLSFAALVSVSPALISLSAQIWNPNIAPFFVLLIIWIITNVSTDRKERNWNYLFLGILLALCIDIEIVFGTLFMTGTIISILVIKKISIPLKSIMSFIVGTLIIFSPRIFFELRHNFLMTKALINFLSHGEAHSSNYVEILLNRINIFIDQFSSSVSAGYKFLGVIFLILSISVIIYFYRKATKLVKNIILFCGVIIITFLIGTVFFSHEIWPHYLVGLPIIYVLIVSISLNLIPPKKVGRYFFPYIFLVILFFLNFNPEAFVTSLTRPVFIGDASVYRNQVAVIDYIYKEASNKKFKYVVYTPPVHDFTYKYLFDWYGPRKYHYKPVSQANLAYFIIEPDNQYPMRVTDWLKIRANDGKIVNTRKFPSGIIVQTRIH